jgi:hypothetical protein
MSNTPQTISDIIKPELPEITALLSLNNTGDIQTMAMQELNYLEQQAALKPIILQCEKVSIVLAVKNVLRKNLSLDPNAGLVYLKTRNTNVGTYEKPIWKLVLEVQETANGIISYNRQIGRMLDCTNPKVKKDSTGKVIGVSMEILKPSYRDTRWELYEFDESDFIRWQRASHKENKKGYKDNKGMKVPNDETLNYANPNYTSWLNGIDPEFARAKCIRHSFKKLGSNPNEQAKLTFKIPEPLIDPRIAITEAEDQDFTPHEEITSQVNESQPHTNNQNDTNNGYNFADL